MLRFSPVYQPFLGDHNYDNELPNNSAFLLSIKVLYQLARNFDAANM